MFLQRFTLLKSDKYLQTQSFYYLLIPDRYYISLTPCTNYRAKIGNNFSTFTNSNWITQSYYSSPKCRVGFQPISKLKRAYEFYPMGENWPLSFAQSFRYHFRYIAVVKPTKKSTLSKLPMVKLQVALIVVIRYVLEKPRYLETKLEEVTCNGYTYVIWHLLNIGSIRIYILTTGVVSNETNTYVRMYIEEFILVDIWIHWS